MRRTTLISLLCILLLSLAGCKHRAEEEPAGDSTQDRYKRETQIPELPYILEGDYTPDTGVVYKVILDGDTCFVVVDQITNTRMIGHYYPLVAGSDCVERKPFTKDLHWKEQRSEATVYLYDDPDYEANTDKRYRKPLYSVEKQSDIIYGSANGYWVSMPLSGKEGYGEILSTGVKNGIFKSKQTLTLDLYQPDNDEPQRPLILL
ncbi:MAG: hypothetical protein K5867_01020, partial [Bacteroidales bacterium]|nr:hypothetical protein [Bacteroidales bacterium]